MGSSSDNSMLRRNLAAKERKIIIYDSINEDSIMEAIYYLHRFRSIDLKRGEKRPIEILINSCGGSVSDGLTLISLIESMKDEGWEINTTNMGYAYSMGFYIGICGTHRYTYRYATYLCHDVSYGCEGNFMEMAEKLRETERLRKILRQITLRYTKLSEEDLDNIFEHKTDKTYSPEDAIALEIADKIV